MSWRIPLADTDIGQEEIDAVTGVLKSKWLTMGEVTADFEQRFAPVAGCRHSIAVSNGTAALHLALLALGVGSGDDVICPALTFVATANAIRYCGARPVFADITALDDWNVSHTTIEAALTARTKAIVVVHYGGYPCDMAPIAELARSRGLGLVEDAAHAPGATSNRRPVGGWGDVGCFSFFSNKNLATGEGGMLTTNRDDLAQAFRRLRSHGMTTLTLDRHKGHAFSYDVTSLGYNYRMTELNAALGLVQLGKLDLGNRRRAALVERYRSNLVAIKGLQTPFGRCSGQSSFHLMPVLLPERCERSQVMDALKTQGIQSSIHYRPVDTFAAYREAGLGPCSRLKLTHHVGDHVITLPLYPALSLESVDDVCKALESAAA